MDMTPNWFISDTHFGHRNIIEYCSRPFGSVLDMDRTMAESFTAVVGPRDLVMWVGDVSFYPPDTTRSILATLPGVHILVRGNHDGSVARCLRAGFRAVMDEAWVSLGGQLVQVTHKPLPEVRKGTWNLHGHTHSRSRVTGRHVHVGVDAWSYAPVCAEHLISLCRAADQPDV